MTDRWEAAALALAESRPKNKHGQLCPVWTQRLKKVRHAVTIEACDCWILADARIDAAVVLAAAEAAPLDVERLARALFGLEADSLRSKDRALRFAESIAREYASLAATSREGSDAD